MYKVVFIFLIALPPLLSQEWEVSGTLLPTMQTNLSSEVSGRIESVLVGTGERVSKGQVLAQLETVNFELDVQRGALALKQAQLAFSDAKTHFERMKKLYAPEGGAVTKQQFDSAESALKQAELQVKQAEIGLAQVKRRLEESRIKAPYDGVITRRLVDPGASVSSMSGPLFEIMQTDELVFEFTLPQTLLGKVHVGQRLSSPLLTSGGKIASILPHIDQASRSLKCRVVIPNGKQTLKPGLFMTATLEVEAP